jgi:hypothetical protein
MSESEDPPHAFRPIVEVTISASVDDVWRALREPAKIREWFGWETESLDAEVEYIFGAHALPDEATHTIGFQGRTDRFEIVRHGEDTVLRLVRAAPTADTDWEDVFDDEVQGWIAFVQQLAFAFARHQGQARRTLFFDGAPRTPTTTAAAIGIPADARTPGTAIDFVAAPGDSVRGTLWHRTRSQVGVTVDAWGDGLLVVIDRPADGKRPRGSTQTILTTYGLDDATFAALQQRWQSWWDERYERTAQTSCE